MANEYLQRTPTSTGNQRVFTISVWYKKSANNTVSSNGQLTFLRSGDTLIRFDDNPGYDDRIRYYAETPSGSNILNLIPSYIHRDNSGWQHILVNFDSTQSTDVDRASIYINGIKLTKFEASTRPAIDALTEMFISGTPINLGLGVSSEYFKGQLCDYFVIDGQALTPDVFGFYKVGKGYISVGSTQSTDFRPGQWVPKTPRVIKTAINNNGGFGVNGFYLPMNDSKNFGADFHGEPNSIITLNEKLPQPRVGVATTASAGIGFTDALRSDPYAANLLVACPFVSGGLGIDGTVSATIPGLGDYHRVLGGQSNAPINIVAGDGTQATVAIGTGVYYGSSLNVTASTIRPRAIVGTALTIVNDYTIEFWAYINSFAADGSHLVQYDTDAGSTGWLVSGDYGQPRFTLRNSSGSDKTIRPSVGIFTTGQWNHFAAVYQRSKGLMNLYLNGVSVGIVTDVPTNYPSTQYSGLNRLNIGSNTGDGSRPMLGYMQDLRIYNTAKYTGGFDVPRPYTPVGIATWRAVPDTTANNFATTNPLDLKQANGSLTFSDGNLKLVGATANRHTRTTIGVTSTSVISGSQSKWYWEYYCLASSPNFHHGISAGESIEKLGVDYLGSAVNTWGYWPNNSGTNTGYWRNEGPGPVYGDLPRAGQGDIMMFALDMTSGKVYAGINGTWFRSGNPATGANALSTNVPLNGTSVFPHFMQYDTTGISINFGQNPTFSGNTTAGTFTDSNGKGLFKYQPPSGFLALCEDNLPTPAIANPGKYFKTVLYTGDGASGRSITGIGFTPDLVWIKERTSASSHALFDSVRGAGKRLVSNSTGAEEVGSESLYNPAFNYDGFSLGSDGAINELSQTYVAWCWRAGAGTTSTNTNGSITSVVSVNQDAGFSIVSYTGTGASNATVGHGLGKVPSFGVVKCRDTNSVSNSWRTQHKGLTSGYYLEGLANTSGQGLISSTSFGSLGTFTSSSTVTLQAGTSDSTTTNESGKRYIMYLWAEIEGFSKFGSYVGNGNADGPMVWCGFKPAFVITKRTDSTGGWQILDSSRMSINSSNTPVLFPNTTGIELGTDVMDFLSNGFKFRSTGTDYNASGGTYIFVAFAESPFQTANAK